MDSIILYGAGKRCQDLYSLLKNSFFKIEAIIDSDSKKYGQMIGDNKIQSLEILRAQHDLPICITVGDYKIREQIKYFLQKEYSYDFSREIKYEDLIISIYENDNNLKHFIHQYEIHNKRETSLIFDCYNGLGLGGVESWTKDICEAFIKNGEENIFIISKRGKYKISSILQNRIIYFDMDSNKRYSYETICQIVKLLLDKLPCKVITCTANEILFAAHLVKKYYPNLIEIISVIHNSTEHMLQSYITFNTSVSLYIAVSQDIKSEMIKKGIREEKIYSMTCPFPCEETIYRTYTLETNKPIRIGYAGRMDGFENSQKRMDLLLELIKLLDKKKVNFQMELAGDGPARILMEEYIQTHSLQTKVTFWGQLNREEIPSFWRKQDICVNIADYEGRSISIIEAMGNGAVPVVTQVSGTQEDITDGVNGYLIPIGDYQTMADKIQYLAEHRERLSEIGSKAHDEVYPKSLMSEHLKFWKHILL